MFILGAAYAPVEAEIQIILGIRVPFLGSLPGQREAFFLIQFNAVRTKVSEAQVRHGLHVSGRNRIFQKLQALPTVLRDAVAIKKALAQIPLRVRKTVFRRFLQPVKGLSFVFFCPPAIETATVEVILGGSFFTSGSFAEPGHCLLPIFLHAFSQKVGLAQIFLRLGVARLGTPGIIIRRFLHIALFPIPIAQIRKGKHVSKIGSLMKQFTRLNLIHFRADALKEAEAQQFQRIGIVRLGQKAQELHRFAVVFYLFALFHQIERLLIDLLHAFFIHLQFLLFPLRLPRAYQRVCFRQTSHCS